MKFVFFPAPIFQPLLCSSLAQQCRQLLGSGHRSALRYNDAAFLPANANSRDAARRASAGGGVVVLANRGGDFAASSWADFHLRLLLFGFLLLRRFYFGPWIGRLSDSRQPSKGLAMPRPSFNLGDLFWLTLVIAALAGCEGSKERQIQRGIDNVDGHSKAIQREARPGDGSASN
jgi:hypothetical protein